MDNNLLVTLMGSVFMVKKIYHIHDYIMPTGTKQGFMYAPYLSQTTVSWSEQGHWRVNWYWLDVGRKPTPIDNEAGLRQNCNRKN